MVIAAWPAAHDGIFPGWAAVEPSKINHECQVTTHQRTRTLTKSVECWRKNIKRKKTSSTHLVAGYTHCRRQYFSLHFPRPRGRTYVENPSRLFIEPKQLNRIFNNAAPLFFFLCGTKRNAGGWVKEGARSTISRPADVRAEVHGEEKYGTVPYE